MFPNQIKKLQIQAVYNNVEVTIFGVRKKYRQSIISPAKYRIHKQDFFWRFLLVFEVFECFESFNGNEGLRGFKIS